MTVRIDDGTIVLEGHCSVEDGAALAEHLAAYPHACVDWSNCMWLHTGVVQVLLALRPPLRGTPAGDFVQTHVAPLLIARP